MAPVALSVKRTTHQELEAHPGRRRADPDPHVGDLAGVRSERELEPVDIEGEGLEMAADVQRGAPGHR